MTSQSTAPTGSATDQGGPQTGPIVQINVNGQNVPIHRGHRSVAEIKDAGHVPPADVLEQVIDGQLTELPDGGSVVIHGGEKFVGHIRGAGSS